MSEENIEKVEELLTHVIEPNKKVVETQISCLIPAGENNLSLVLRVDFVIKNEEDGTREEINAVAKVMPALEIMRFAYEYNFRNEVAFYDIIVPTLKDFHRERGVENVIDLFPRLYMSRANLHGTSDKVDENAVLLMENLTMSGYINLDRMIGLDLETTRSVLKDLATFHAVPLALKRLKPEVFKEKISPHFVKGFPRPKNGGKHFNPGAKVIEILEQCEEFIEFLPVLRENMDGFRAFTNQPDGLFSSICHGDLWVNNILTNFDNGKPVKNKFVDYQVFTHNSLAKDVFFFLWSSLQQPLLENNLDELIKFYYDNFIENLEHLNCETTPFTFETFLEEIMRISRVEFGHVIIMYILVIFGRRGGNIDAEGRPKPVHLLEKEDVTSEALSRSLYMVKECIKRGWLY